jgi:hypothetical protein
MLRFKVVMARETGIKHSKAHCCKFDKAVVKTTAVSFL